VFSLWTPFVASSFSVVLVLCKNFQFAISALVSEFLFPKVLSDFICHVRLRISSLLTFSFHSNPGIFLYHLWWASSNFFSSEYNSKVRVQRYWESYYFTRSRQLNHEAKNNRLSVIADRRCAWRSGESWMFATADIRTSSRQLEEAPADAPLTRRPCRCSHSAERQRRSTPHM